MSRGGRTVGLNGLFLDYPFSGTWTYTRNLVRALPAADPTIKYELSMRNRTAEVALSENVSISIPHWPRGAQRRWSVSKRADKLGWEQIAWPAASRRCDLLHSLYFAAPVWRPAPLVVTVHDAVSLKEQNRHSSAAGVYARAMAWTARKASVLIAVSEHARNEVASALDFPIERIHVIAEAPDPAMRRVEDADEVASLRARYALPERFVLYLGGTERRKNLLTLVEAWARLEASDVKLVIVGRFPAGDPLFPDIPRFVRVLGIGDHVQFVEFVEQSHLPALFSAATLFCFPSIHEGFGLPPVEAMACGAPVIAAAATSLPEVLGDGADLVEGESVQAWSATLGRLLGDDAGRSELAKRGTAWVSRYSWEATARATVDVYNSVLDAS